MQPSLSTDTSVSSDRASRFDVTATQDGSICHPNDSVDGIGGALAMKNRGFRQQNDVNGAPFVSPSSATNDQQQDETFDSYVSLDQVRFSGIADETTKCRPRVCGESSTTLLLTHLEKIPQKDFVSEIRASLDIDTFIKEATMLLDLDSPDLDSILDQMLGAVFTNMKTLNVPISPQQTVTSEARDVLATTVENNQWTTTASAKFPTITRSSHNFATIQSQQDVEKLIAEAKQSLTFEAMSGDYKYQRLSKTIKGVSLLDGECLALDQSWLCALCTMNSISRRYLALARLATPVNLGRSSEGTCLIVLVIAPTKEKGTKSAIEIGRTFGTILSDPQFRSSLMYAANPDEVKTLLSERALELSTELGIQRRRSSNMAIAMNANIARDDSMRFGAALYEDLRRRLPSYWSDMTEGITGKNTISKTLSTTLFLYFACLLPSIAFGVLNFNNTGGKIAATHVIIAQTFGGLCNGFFGGQPLIVLLSTAPLALYIKIIYSISSSYGVDFGAMYGCVGLFNSLLLIIYSVTGTSRWMRWSTRSTEEIFGLFISIAFLLDAARDCYKTFQEHYVCPVMTNTTGMNQSTLTTEKAMESLIQSANNTLDASHGEMECQRDVALLYLLLLLGTVLLALYLFNFTKTPFLTAGKRELLTDFALPISVLVMSIIGSLAFKDIEIKSFTVRPSDFQLTFIPLWNLDWRATLGAFGLSIPLSLLFYMEQNIASAIVNSPANRLRKGAANHWDLMVVALINVFLSMFCLPWVHAALPHSPLHVRALADIEERVEMGNHIRQIIVRVRETRLTTIFSHILIGLSLLMIPVPLNYIPPAVLNGLFVYMAVTAVYDNQLFERILLFITEQAAYPPSHYIRRVPQRKIHLFTLTQVIQLTVLCIVGFAPSPYVKLVFPLLLVAQIFIRHKLVPRIIDRKYLEALDRSF